MDVILLEKMRNLGALGDKVKVKSGFARNFLVPQGKAVYATKENIVKFEQRRAELEKIAKETHRLAVEKQQVIEALPVLTIVAKAGEEGKLFGSINTRDISAAVNAALEKSGSKLVVEKREVRLSEGTLRRLGDYELTIDLDSDVTATIKLSIVNEG